LQVGTSISRTTRRRRSSADRQPPFGAGRYYARLAISVPHPTWFTSCWGSVMPNDSARCRPTRRGTISRPSRVSSAKGKSSNGGNGSKTRTANEPRSLDDGQLRLKRGRERTASLDRFDHAADRLIDAEVEVAGDFSVLPVRCGTQCRPGIPIVVTSGEAFVLPPFPAEVDANNLSCRTGRRRQ